MTIGVGVLASDGIVIAADTQESVQGYWKTSQGKVRWCGYQTLDHGNGACIVTGAGHARHLDSIQHQITSDFLSRKTMVGWDSHIKEVIRQLHIEHVVPFTQDPPTVSLLGASEQVQQDGRRTGGLWATDKTVVAPYEHFAAVGIGMGHAVNILSRLWRYDSLDVVATSILVAYVIFQVKDYVDGCGDYTDLVVVKDSKAYFLTREEAAKLEAVFRRMSNTESAMSRFLFSPAHGDFSSVAEELRETRNKFMAIIAESRGPYSVFGLDATGAKPL